MAVPKAGIPSASQLAAALPIDESTTKGKALNAATGIAADAAAGALSGGAGGAVVGAAKGIVRNKHSRRLVIRISLAAAIVAILVVVGVVGSTVALLSSITGNQSAATNKAELSAQVSQADADQASRAVAGTVVPQSVYVALQQTAGTRPDVSKLSAQMVQSGLTGDANSPAAGAVVASGGMLKIGTDSQSTALAARTHDKYIAALTGYGLTSGVSEQVFELARRYQLGVSNGCGTTTTTASTAGGGASASGSYSPAQVANIQAVIGIAKTMFGAQAESAAIVGLATAAVESGFQNYANSTIPYSLTIAHDAVGSDHDSVGIMQQRVSGSWGASGTSTWQSDPNGVVDRLMTPSFAASRFYERLQGITGWQFMDPGQAAQTVQVSARPDAYAGKVAAAQALWAQYGASAPAIPLPTGAATTTTAPGAVTASAVVCSTAQTGSFPTGPVTPGPWGGYQNGQIPLSALTLVSWDPSHGDGGVGTYLRPDAAAALGELNTAFTAQFGYALPLNDGYRDFNNQLGAYVSYGFPRAALPGTSNHGWAMAVDIGDASHGQLSASSPEFAWLVANGPQYGWFHFGSVGNGEAWHFQFYGKGGTPS